MGFCSMPKGCLVLPNIVSPLREKPVLFPDPGIPVPTASRAFPHPHPILSLVGELGAAKWKIFQTLIVKPLTLTSPCERSSQACVFFGFSPDSRKM